MTEYRTKALLLMGIASCFTFGLGTASFARDPVRTLPCSVLKNGETLSDISVDLTATTTATIPNAVTIFDDPGYFCLKIRLTGTMQCIAPASRTCTIKPVVRSERTFSAYFMPDALAGSGTLAGAPRPSAVSMQFFGYYVWSGPGTPPLQNWTTHFEVTVPPGGRLKIDNALMTVERYDHLP